jgi:16S rRNA G1207 methylase RsmC
LIPQRSSSSGDDDSMGTDARKMRLVTMLKQAFGNDVEKVPGFIEFAQSAKEDCRRTFVDAAAQTSYDLLETWFPALRKRIAQSEKLINNNENEDIIPSVVKTNQKYIQSKPHQLNQHQKHLGMSLVSTSILFIFKIN